MVINCRSVSGTGSGSGCSSPCSCIIADDGIRQVGGNYVVNTGEGRRNTVVSGQGTVGNPYTVSFIDSEFFRPEAGEFSYPDQTTLIGYDELNFGNGPGIVAYQTPHVIFSGIGAGGNGVFTVKGFFQFVGASATFPAGSAGDQVRKIAITYDDGTLEQLCAANTMGTTTTETLELSASGFYPGRFTSPVGYSTFRVYVWRDSGAPQLATKLKFWVGSL